MKDESKGRWSWMNALSGLLAGIFLSLGVVNNVSGALPSDIDLAPMLPLMALITTACAILAGAAKMQVPDNLVVLKKLVTLGRGVIVVVALALAISLVISGYQYQASHPAPPGWAFPAW